MVGMVQLTYFVYLPPLTNMVCPKSLKITSMAPIHVGVSDSFFLAYVVRAQSSAIASWKISNHNDYKMVKF